MGNATGTNPAGKKPFDPNDPNLSSADITNYYANQNEAMPSVMAPAYTPPNTNSPAQAVNPYYGGFAPTAMAKSGSPINTGSSISAPVLVAPSIAGGSTSGSDRTGLGGMNAQYATNTKPAVNVPSAATTAADPLAYLSAFKQAPNTGGIDPYSGTSQSLADMSSADLAKYYADRTAAAAANPAGNPANATQAANGNLNNIPAPNTNVYNPYAGTPGTGGSTGNAGTNTVVAANPAGGVAAGPGGVAPGTPTSAAGSVPGNPFNNAPNSTVLNPYMMQQAQSIMDMQNRNLNEGAFQQIKDNAMMNGGYGGDRQGIAEGVAMRGADQNTRAQLGSLFSNAYESQAGRDLSRYQGDQSNSTNRFGIQTGANTAASNLQGQQAMANAQLQSGMESNRNNFYTAQRGQDFEQQRLGMQLYGQGQQGRMGGFQGLGGIYDANNSAPWQQLQNYSNLASPFTGGGATTGPGPDHTAQYAQLAGTVASMVMMSDPATKKNIELVGTRPDGLNEYEWEYKKKYQNDPFAGEGRMRGLMTNEVEKIYPKAVVRHPSKDVKMINYGLLSQFT